MTARQETFLNTLIAERVEQLRTLAAGEPSDEQRKARFLVRWSDGEFRSDTLDTARASRTIDWLLTVPRDSGSVSAATPTTIDVPAGRYAIEDEQGVVKFYRVDRPTEGKWAGRTFVNAQASDEWHAIRNRDSRDAILAAIAADPQAAMIRYGHELGRCGNCGRTLTDETSRAMGIGPECAAQLGIDRTPYTERARRERVEAIREAHEAGDDESPAAPALHESGTVELDAYNTPAATVELDDQRERGEWHPPVEDDMVETLTRRVEPTNAPRVVDPSRTMTWRQRNAAVREQQATNGTGTVTQPRTSARHQAMVELALGGKIGPFTLYVADADPVEYDDGAKALGAARAAFNANPLRRITLVDSTSDLVVEYDL